MFKNFYLLALILISNNAFAISATTPAKIADGTAIERIQAYATSSTKSKTIGIVEPGTELIEFKTFMKTKPGLAMMDDNSWDRSIQFDRGAPIQIWEYLGDGYSKVIINNVTYNTKIARSLEECKRFPASPKYCWVRVVEEPEYYEWKQVALKQEGQRFWILNRIVDGSGIIVVKDKGIEKARIVSTKYIEKPEEIEEEVVEKQDNKLMLDPELLTGDTKENSLENNTAKMLILNKEDRAKARKEAKEKLKEMNGQKSTKQDSKSAELSQEEVFKQQNIKTLEAPIENATANTLQIINKELNEQPATKLKLEKNKPLTLPVVQLKQ